MNTEKTLMKSSIRIAFATLAIASIPLAAVQAGTTSKMDEASLSEWEHMVSLESCINGEVSASGLYPSQIAEDKSFATLGVLADLSSR
jgi:hypothetical protein